VLVAVAVVGVVVVVVCDLACFSVFGRRRRTTKGGKRKKKKKKKKSDCVEESKKGIGKDRETLEQCGPQTIPLGDNLICCCCCSL
jgi:hypothetical protein